MLYSSVVSKMLTRRSFYKSVMPLKSVGMVGSKYIACECGFGWGDGCGLLKRDWISFQRYYF